jgi:hypothetical protein
MGADGILKGRRYERRTVILGALAMAIVGCAPVFFDGPEFASTADTAGLDIR